MEQCNLCSGRGIKFSPTKGTWARPPGLKSGTCTRCGGNGQVEVGSRNPPYKEKGSK